MQEFSKTEKDFKFFEKELSALLSVKHTNIASFYGFAYSKNRAGMVTELCTNGLLQYFFFFWNNSHKVMFLSSKQEHWEKP